MPREAGGDGEQRDEALHPPVDRHVVDVDAAFGERFLEQLGGVGDDGPFPAVDLLRGVRTARWSLGVPQGQIWCPLELSDGPIKLVTSTVIRKVTDGQVGHAARRAGALGNQSG